MLQVSAEELKRLRAMLDRAEIDEVHNDYFNAMDTRNFPLLSRVFTQDAYYTATLIGHDPVAVRGYAEIETTIRNVDVFHTSRHGTRNRTILIDGDEASAVVVALDALLDKRPRPEDAVAGSRLIQHGLRYTDKLVRTDEGWRIRERHLVCLWQQVR